MKLNKKIVIAIVLVAIVAVVGLVAYTLLPPSNGGTPTETGYLLRLNYNVGDKLVYDLGMEAELLGENTTQELGFEMEIVDFDGENYTIEQTYIEKETGYSLTATVKANQTGYLVDYVSIESEAYAVVAFGVSDMAVFGTIFPIEEVKLGESWETDINIGFAELEMSEIDFSGTHKYTLSEVTDETLKLDIESSVVMTAYGGTNTIDASGTIFLDPVTCSLVEITYSATIKLEAEGQSIEGEVTMHGRLVE